jgi:hypothetical protein
MTDKATMDSMDWYKLADFLGLSLKVSGGKVSGKGQLKTNWGLTPVRLVADIFAGKIYKDGTIALLIATPGDLGIGVCFSPVGHKARVFVMDRSKLTGRGKGFLDGPLSIDAAGVLFQKHCVARFKGAIGEAFEAY